MAAEDGTTGVGGGIPGAMTLEKSMKIAVLALLAACSQPAPLPLQAAACTYETPLVAGVPGSPGHLVVTETNPNGQSELALLMRGMQADLRAVKGALEAGQPVPALAAPHGRIRCAWPTTPSDRTATYDAFAQAYLARLPALEAPGAGVAEYNAALDGCVACHQQSCPGPLAAIQALRLAP
jgi:hypothetical protein